jgi:hypothetical protein
MAGQSKHEHVEPPLTPDESAELEPDPARSYERAKPQKEYGDDRLDAEPNRPQRRPDEAIRAVHNAHGSRQINDESGTDAADSNPL